MCVCVGAGQYFLIQSELAESLTQDGKFCVFSSYSSAKFSCSHSCFKASIKHHQWNSETCRIILMITKIHISYSIQTEPSSVFFFVILWYTKCQAWVVQKLDSAIHRINHYLVDKCYGNQLRYPRDSGLSSGLRYPTFEQLGPELKTLLGAL